MIDGRENGHVMPIADAREDSPMALVRFGSGLYPGMHVEEVFSAVYVPVCSPRLLKGEHGLKTPQDLRFHTLLHDDTVQEEGARPSWSDFLASVGVKGMDASRGPHFSDASLALEAAIEGMGIALAMKPLVSAEIEAGRLATPFDVSAPTSYSYFLVTPESSVENPAIAAFRGWLMQEALPERA
jgi:LysR family glycine cleavage system transcriptional activator